MDCRECRQSARRQQRLFRRGLIPVLESYENIHALHLITWERRASIARAALALGIEVPRIRRPV